MSLFDLINGDDEKAGGRVDGVAVAIVTNNQDPNGAGRVKLKFPWREQQDESDWARVATLMAGNGRGSFFLPEVNDEVLVAFEQGDVEKPYVIGALWNGRDKPPEANSNGKNNIRKFTSRSGHELIFNDDGDQRQEKIELHTRAGHTVVLDDSGGAEKIEIKDKTGSNSILIDSAQNSIKIESAMQLKIKSQRVEIEADSMLTIKAGATLTIQGTLVKIN